MPNRYKNIDFVKTFASIPPDIIDLMQKGKKNKMRGILPYCVKDYNMECVIYVENLLMKLIPSIHVFIG